MLAEEKLLLWQTQYQKSTMQKLTRYLLIHLTSRVTVMYFIMNDIFKFTYIVEKYIQPIKQTYITKQMFINM